MRRNDAVRFVLLFVSFCLWHFQPPHVSFAQSPRQPKLFEQKLSEVSSDKVSDWIRVQIEDLGYALDIADKVSKALSGRTWKVLMEMPYERMVFALESTELAEDTLRGVSDGLLTRIQRGAPQPQPLQPVSWQRSYVFCCICSAHSKTCRKGQK